MNGSKDKMSNKTTVYLLILLSACVVNSHTPNSSVLDHQFDRFCTDNKYCKTHWNNHSVCVPSLSNPDIKECHCYPNLKFNEANKLCEPFQCSKDKDCQDWDIKRICRGGLCECEQTYEEQLDYVYLCVHVVYEAPTSLLWLWLLFVVPVIAVVSVIVNNIYKCRTRNRFRY